jgi:lysophospholipase L1-like esterase
VVLAALVAVAACSGGDDDASPETTKPEPLTYVALGDSFSSGEGARDYDPASGACHRSRLSWPHLLDDGESDIVLEELRACGGATIDRLLSPWSERGEPAQIPAEPRPDVGLVTLTVGGNDIGFGAIVVECVLLDCTGVPDRPELQVALDALSRRLTEEVHPALEAAYPNALIVHVGYPRLTPQEGPLVACAWLTESERAATVEIVDRLNETIARADPDVFADIGDALAGHEECTDDPWVNQVFSFDSERAHPTAEGYEAVAEAVAFAMAGDYRRA